MSLVSECRPHVSPPIDLPLLPRSLSVNESPLPDSDEACHSRHSGHPPPETEIVTKFTGHRMHDTSHSIKVDFNGSDLFYSTDNQFTFTVHFTSQIAIVSDMKVQS